MKRIEQGGFGVLRADPERHEFPEGAVVLIMSHNTPQKQYHITNFIKDEATIDNPYYLENEETKFRVTKRQFDTGEFVPYSEVEAIDLSYQYPVVKFLKGTIARIALGVLLMCSGALIALEFLK